MMDFGALPLDLLGKIFTGAGWAGGWITLVWVLLRHNKRVVDGDLVPRRTHEDALKTIELQQKRLDLQAETGRDMADALGTVEQFIDSLPRVADRRQLPRGGGR